MVPARSFPLEQRAPLLVPQPLYVVLIKSYALMVLASRPLLCVLLLQPAQQDRRSAPRIGNAILQQTVQAQVSLLNALQLLLFYARLVHARLQLNSVVSREVVLYLPHAVVFSARMGLASLLFKLVCRSNPLCNHLELPSLLLLL